MRISFPYPSFKPVEIPERNLLGVYESKYQSGDIDLNVCIADAQANPVSGPHLSDLARGAKSVLIISDDYTRQTPVKQIIPQLVDALHRTGISDAQIRILVALGTHRPMTDEEKLAKFGHDIVSRFEIINHNWQDEENLISVGNTSSGIEISVNSALTESDLIIGLGQVAPHRIAGYSGGAKIILPGVCGRAASEYTHWIGGMLPGEQVLGVWDNPVRREMNEAGQLARLQYIVNAVCDPEGRVVGIFAGSSVETHCAASELARDVFGVQVPSVADIVIVDSFPKDIELWQAAKALYSAEVMVRPGGVVILVSPCNEGVSKSHPLILERGYKTESETLWDVESGTLTNKLVASHCLRVGRIIKDRATGILVSSGIKDSDARHLGFIPAPSVQDALDKAFDVVRKHATVSVLRHGGEALPVMG